MTLFLSFLFFLFPTVFFFTFVFLFPLFVLRAKQRVCASSFPRDTEKKIACFSAARSIPNSCRHTTIR